MLGADFVLTSPGNAQFEAFALGACCLSFFQNSFQEEVFTGFPVSHPAVEIERLESLMEDVYSDYSGYRTAIDSLEIGQGCIEIADAVVGEPA